MVGEAGRVARVLVEDSNLGQAVPAERRAAAERECVAHAIEIERGPWEAERYMLGAADPGLLVLEGLLIRRVGEKGRFGAELLGEGDVLRPWQRNGEAGLPFHTSWEVLEPLRVAVLDVTFAQRLGRYPQILGGLLERLVARSRVLAVNMAIVHYPRVDVRLHMLLWHLAERWGRVGPGGVTITKRLTHAVLADLVAAQRPSVTSALSRLADQGLIDSVDRRWRLIGQPPGELTEMVRRARLGG
jgi:CRP-like cAMP-binding protein